MTKIYNDDLFIDRILNDELDEKEYTSRQLRSKSIKLYLTTHFINAFLSNQCSKEFSTSFDIIIRRAMNEIIFKQQHYKTISPGAEMANLRLLINHTSTINKDFDFFYEDLFEEDIEDRKDIIKVIYEYDAFKKWAKSDDAINELKYIKKCSDKIISKQSDAEKDKAKRAQNTVIDNLFNKLLNAAGVESNKNLPTYMKIKDDKFNLKKNGMVGDFGFPSLAKFVKDEADKSGAEIKLINNRHIGEYDNSYSDISVDMSIPASLYFGMTDQYQLIANRSTIADVAEVFGGTKKKIIDRHGNEVVGPYAKLDMQARLIQDVKDKANMKQPNGLIQFALYGNTGWTKAKYEDITPESNAMTALLSAGNFSVRAGHLLKENKGFKKVNKNSKHSDLLLYVLDFDAHDPETNSVNLLPTESDLKFIANNYGDGKVVYQKTPHGMHVFFTAPMNPRLDKNHVKTVRLRVNLDSRLGTKEGFKEVPIDVRCDNGYAVVSGDSYGNIHSICSFNQFTKLVKDNLDFEDYAEVISDDEFIVDNFFGGKEIVNINGIDKEATKRFIKSLDVDNDSKEFKRFVYNHTTSLFIQLIKKGTKELFEIPYSPEIDPSVANRNKNQYIIYDDMFGDTLTTFTSDSDDKRKTIYEQKTKTNSTKAYAENHANRLNAVEHSREGEYKRYKYDIATPQLPKNPRNLVATSYYEEGCRNNVVYTFALWLNKNGVDIEKATRYINNLNNSAKDSLSKNEVMRAINSAYNEPKGIDDGFFNTMSKCIRNNEINKENYLKIALDRDEFNKAMGFSKKSTSTFRKAVSRKWRVYSHYDEALNDFTRIIEHYLFPLNKFDANKEVKDSYKFIKTSKLTEYMSEYRELDRNLRPTMVKISQSNMHKIIRIAKRLSSLPEENKKIVLAGFVIDKIKQLNVGGVKKYDKELLQTTKNKLIDAIKEKKITVKQLKHIEWYANKLFNLALFNKKAKDIKNINDSTTKAYRKLISYMSIHDIATLLSLSISSKRGINGGTMIHVSNAHLYYETRLSYNKSIQAAESDPNQLANSFVDSIDYASDRTYQFELKLQRRIIKNKACFIKHSLLTSKPFDNSNEFTDEEISDSKTSGVRDNNHKAKIICFGAGTVAIDINKSQVISNKQMNRDNKCKIISIFDQENNKDGNSVPIDLSLCY